MSDQELAHTQIDVDLLRQLISTSMFLFAQKMKLEQKALSPYAQSDIANSARIVYSYLIKDCKTDAEKKRVFSDEVFIYYGTIIADSYKNLLDFRYATAAKGIRVYSELSFTLESTLTYLIRCIQPYSQLNPAVSLLPDLFLKFFSQALGLMKMLNLDLSSEAYSNWRTLHEAECVIKLLVEGGKD